MSSKYRYIPFAVLAFLACSCSMTGRLDRTPLRPLVSLADEARGEVDLLQSGEDPRQAGKKGLVKGIEQTRGQSKATEQARTRDEVTGEDVVTVDLDEVTVVARSRTVPERRGTLKLDFMIMIPRKLIDSRWMVTLTPSIERSGKVTQLEEVVINGEVYRLYQEKGAAMYEAITERYKRFNRDTTRIWDYFYEKYNLKRNTDARLDTIIPSGSNFNYYYTQEVPADGAKRIDLFIRGDVRALDKSCYALPLSDTISYFVSSMTQLIDPTPRHRWIGSDEIDKRYAKGVEWLQAKEYEEALKILADYKDYNTAIAYISLGQNEPAYDILVREEPKTGNSEYLLAIVCSRLGKETEAIQRFLYACQLDDSKAWRGMLDPEINRLIETYDLKKDIGL